MKSSEFIRIDEGVGSWIADKAAKSGILGKERQVAAVGAQMQREKTALNQKLGQMVRQENYNKFVKELPTSIQGAINSGVVRSVGSRSPGKLSISQFVKQYVTTLFSTIRLSPEFNKALDQAIRQFELAYKNQYNPQTPELSGNSLLAARKIWDVYETASKSTPSTSSGNYPVPPAGEEVITAKGKYEFNGTKWHMTEKVTSPPGSRFPALSPLPTPKLIHDPAQILELNRLAASA